MAVSSAVSAKEGAAAGDRPAHPEPPFRNDELDEIVDKNFVINRDTTALRQRDFVMNVSAQIANDASVYLISKLSLSYPAKLYGRIRVTAKQPRADNKAESWKAFKRELTFISREASRWHNHPNILQYYGLVFYKDDLEMNIPYLLSERVDRNLIYLLDAENKIYWTQRGKVSVVYDIACGLSFLHSRKPRPIVHGALSEASVLINNERKTAKISNFVNAGYEGEPLNIISVHDLPVDPTSDRQIPCAKNGAKLVCKLDMISLGLIVKAIDVEHKLREPMTTNILEDLYALYTEHEDGLSSKYTADEVCQNLFGYLENQQEGQRNGAKREQEPPPTGIKRMTRLLEEKFVGLFAAGGEDKDVAENFHVDLFGSR